mmetsp:Transcript_2046/g.5857  ORF Transcript_2046/g.5857 Transcript_2046/m.5857 type:complete len:281 (+) Transcript_2046:195-1037(+)
MRYLRPRTTGPGRRSAPKSVDDLEAPAAHRSRSPRFCWRQRAHQHWGLRFEVPGRQGAGLGHGGARHCAPEHAAVSRHALGLAEDAVAGKGAVHGLFHGHVVAVRAGRPLPLRLQTEVEVLERLPLLGRALDLVVLCRRGRADGDAVSDLPRLHRVAPLEALRARAEFVPQVRVLARLKGVALPRGLAWAEHLWFAVPLVGLQEILARLDGRVRDVPAERPPRVCLIGVARLGHRPLVVALEEAPVLLKEVLLARLEELEPRHLGARVLLRVVVALQRRV